MSEIIGEKFGGSEAIFKTVVDESMIGFVIIQDDLVKYVNHGVAEIFGYTIEEMMNWNTQEFLKAVHPQDKRKVVKTLKRGTSEKRKPLELRIKAKNDKYIWIEINSKKFKYDNQKGVILICRNISDRKILEQKYVDSKKNLENIIHSLPEIRFWKLFYPKKYEEALKTSYEMLQKVIDNIPENIFWKDTNLIYLGCNQNYANLIGVGNPDNVIGETDKGILLENLLTKEKVKELEEKELYLIKSNKPEYHIFESWILKNGAKIWFDINRIPLFNSENIVAGILVTYDDITEIKKAEENLKESEEKFRIITEQSLLGIAILQDDVFKYMNNQFADIFGYSVNEIINLQPNEYHKLTHPEDLSITVKQAVKKQIGEPDIINHYEFRGLKKAGETVWIEILSRTISYEDKTSDLIAILDITEKKIAERKLKESEEILKKFINSATDGFLLLDSKLNIIEANRIAIFILGINNEDLDTKNILEITPLLRERSRYDELMGVLKTGMPFFIGDRFNHSELGIIDVAISAFKVGDGLGMIFTNITKHKQIEQELKEISELKTELLTRTSHELKTPLVSIKGNADLLLKEFSEKFDFETIEIVEEIKRGSLKLEDLISELLKSSKLEMNQIELKASYEDLVFLINFTVNELKGLVNARNQKIFLELHDKLNTKFEKEKIFEVISNLLSNAIKYTPSGGEIKIQTEIKDNYCIVSVKDNGIGFIKEEKQRIFTQFGKIERYGKGLDLGIEGSGLGLYISKKIVELHGGKIWMESEGRNKGSMFFFSLPIIK